MGAGVEGGGAEMGFEEEKRLCDLEILLLFKTTAVIP